MSASSKLGVIALASCAACGGDTAGPGTACNLRALPLTGAAAAPSLTAVTLEVQPSGIVVLATVTDPQGTDDLLNVVQTISVYRDARCSGTPIVLQDDIAGSGVEESFGTAVDASADAALYAAIAAAASWPVEVDLRDQAGNRTTGRVAATVVD